MGNIYVEIGSILFKAYLWQKKCDMAVGFNKCISNFTYFVSCVTAVSDCYLCMVVFACRLFLMHRR